MTTKLKQNQNSSDQEVGDPNNDRVRIFDTTLRDGEQSPGAAMTLDEKLEVATLLGRNGRRHH